MTGGGTLGRSIRSDGVRGLLLLALLASSPLAWGEIPPKEADVLFRFFVTVNEPNFVVPWNGAQVIPLTFHDVSETSRLRVFNVNPTTALPNLVSVEHRIEPAFRGDPPHGWGVTVTPISFLSYGGTETPVEVRVFASTVLRTTHVRIVLTFTMVTPNGTRIVQDLRLPVQVGPHHEVVAYPTKAPPVVRPNNPATVFLNVINAGPYPDTFLLQADLPEGWSSTLPLKTTLFGFENSTVAVTFLPPESPYVPRKGNVLSLTLESVHNSSSKFLVPVVVIVEGFSDLGTTLPLLFLSTISLVTFLRWGSDRVVGTYHYLRFRMRGSRP